MIKLRPLRIGDASGILEWMNDQDISQNLNIQDSQKNLESILKFIESAQTSFPHVHKAIVDEKDQYLGTVSLKNIHPVHGHAEFAIVLRKQALGKGYGKIAIQAILKLAQDELKLHKIYLNVLKTNVIAKHVYESAGFKVKGEFIDHLFKEGQYHSLDYYEIILGDIE